MAFSTYFINDFNSIFLINERLPSVLYYNKKKVILYR